MISERVNECMTTSTLYTTLHYINYQVLHPRVSKTGVNEEERYIRNVEEDEERRKKSIDHLSRL
jgi:hypothetical protein